MLVLDGGFWYGVSYIINTMEFPGVGMDSSSACSHDFDISNYSVSFAGCGFLCIYHAGVCAALKEHAPQVLENKLCGASAGSLIAVALACKLCISRATSVILHVVTQARSVVLGAFNNDFDLMKVLRKDLEALLPENAHKLCSGRVYISMTRLDDFENVTVSEFINKEDLIQAILCSCFIPIYGGFCYPKFRGVAYIDGGVTDNQPSPGENTLTVSPFAGEADICPKDNESASMLNFNFGGTSIRFTGNNFQRLSFCLFPPSTDVCSQIFHNGFSDALRYLVNNDQSAKARNVILEADFVYTPTHKRSLHQSESSLDTGIKSEKRSESITVMDHFSRSKMVFEAFKSQAGSKVGTTTAYILSFKLFRGLHGAARSLSTSFHLARFFKSFTLWIARQIVNLCFLKSVRNIFVSLIGKLEDKFGEWLSLDFGDASLERCTNQLELKMTEYNAFVSERAYYRRQIINPAMTPEQEKELNLLEQFDLLNKDSPYTLSSLTLIPEIEDDPSSDYDSHNKLITSTWMHDAACAYYYLDEQNKVHVCNIFGERNSDFTDSSDPNKDNNEQAGEG